MNFKLCGAKKPHTNKYGRYDSIYIKFKNRQNKSMIIDSRSVFTLGGEWGRGVLTTKEHSFWGYNTFIQLLAIGVYIC